MPEPVSIRQVFDLPPEQAIAFLDSKGYRTSVDWTDTFNEEHDASFTAAKIAKVDLLRDIHVSLLDALADGKPFEQWRSELERVLRDKGWLGKVVDEELTGTADPVIVGPRRLRTIYDTNIRMARSVGLWQRIQANKEALPFLRYSAVLDRRTRPQHRAWHEIILPVDHPFWLTHFPPNGWNCFLPGTRISGRPVAGIRHWHDGKAVEITTVAGRRLSVTPDHPILTRRGWVLAQHVNKGDKLLGHLGGVDTGAGTVMHNDQSPATAEQVFDSLSPQGFAVGQAAPNDFDTQPNIFNHDPDVHVIDGKPCGGFHAAFAQQIDKLDLDRALQGAGIHAPDGGAARTIGAGDASGCDNRARPGLAATDLPGCGGKAQIRVAIQPDDGLFELRVARAGGSPGGGALPFDPLAFAFDVAPLHQFRLGSAAQDDALRLELSAQACAADAGLFGHLFQAGTGSIAEDEVIEVRHFDFCGHVYDFQTTTGLIVAEGLVSHNCRCTVIQLSQAMLDRRGWKVTANPPAIDLVPFRRKGGATVYQIPRGIDPGFGYNAGRARQQAVADKVAQSLTDAAAQGLPDAVPVALAEILAEFPGGLPDRATIDRLTGLARNLQVAELAAALAELLGVAG